MSGEREDGSPVAVLRNPATGVSVRADDDAVEIRLAPGAPGPVEHVHPRIEERFEVVDGRPTFRVDGRERAQTPGREIRVSPGTPHAFRNDGDEPVLLRGRTVPESERLAAVVATLFGLAREGRTDARGRPGLLQAAVMAEGVDETYAAGVPRPLQEAFGALVGPVGRALGYRATYDRYLEESFWTTPEERP
jgi:mannose-6-phosphate isomerase-like protein (cupin superfamily)